MRSGSLKKFRKITIRNRNLCKILKCFLLPTLVIILTIAYISVSERLDPSNFQLFWSKYFRCAAFHHLLAGKNSTPELLSIRSKIKKYEIFFYSRNTFFPIVSSISHQRDVFRGSNFQIYVFKNYLPINYWGIHLWKFIDAPHVLCAYLILGIF